MPARTGTAPVREIDFSAVGKAGRRTGITLPQQRLDEHGLEEMSHLFSSPKKPSPLKNFLLADSNEDEANNVNANPRPSDTRPRTPRASIPRAVSPRKSGISGTAKRASGLDIRSPKKNGDINEHQPDGQENAPSTPSTRLSKRSYRHLPTSSAKAPLRDITRSHRPTNRFQPENDDLEPSRDGDSDVVQSVEDVPSQDAENRATPQQVTPTHQTLSVLQNGDADEDDGPIPGDEDTDDTASESAEHSTEMRHLAEDDVEHEQERDEEAEQPAALDPPLFAKPRALSGRKRRSDLEIPDSSPAVKRHQTSALGSAKVKTAARTQTKNLQGPEPVQPTQQVQPVQPPARGRPPLNNKDTNTKMSKYQEKELDQAIERIRSRPNPPKSLYILRRETPSDDTVTRTRSGRVSFKPLAYWRNERCVWGSSPSGTGIRDGARFPLNSIKEIIRTEEEESAELQKTKGNKGKKTKTKKSKTSSKSRLKNDEDGEAQDDEQPSDSSELANDDDDDDDDDDDLASSDPHAEEWEIEQGSLYGNVSVWDSYLQQPSQAEEEIEIAIAEAAMEKTGIKHPSQGEDDEPEFEYAKLLGNEFMGAGIVDLAPGGIKRPKNSKKMHMAFYVVKGRVTVTVGPVQSDPPTTFSIGKGGFWQVPRGNQYSIENVLDKPARIFFSQGCEVEVGLDD